MTESSAATDTSRERLTTDQLAHPNGDAESAVEQRLDRTDPQADLQIAQDPSADPRVNGGDAVPAAGTQQAPAQLLDSNELAGITRRWSDIQAAFVDAPQQAVQDADALVADLMQHLAQMFATERQQLEGQWSRGGTVSTEDLRVSLQRYRSFFQRLLSV
jgi:hypothetical protein